MTTQLSEEEAPLIQRLRYATDTHKLFMTLCYSHHGVLLGFCLTDEHKGHHNCEVEEK